MRPYASLEDYLARADEMRTEWKETPRLETLLQEAHVRERGYLDEMFRLRVEIQTLRTLLEQAERGKE